MLGACFCEGGHLLADDFGSPGQTVVVELDCGRPDLSSMALISIIDDDEDFRVAITDLIEVKGFKVEAFASAVDFLAHPNVCHTSCLIADVHMPRMTGIELHSYLVGSGRDIPTVLITAFPDDSARVRALGQGVVCYLSKPVDEETLFKCVGLALQRAQPHQNLSGPSRSPQ